MAAKIDICNFALQEIGAKTITSLNEGTTEATQCNLRYESAKRQLLRMHLWNFAIRRASLNRLTASPIFNYSYMYSLPSDFLYSVMTGEEEGYQGGVPVAVNDTQYVYGNPSYYSADKYRLEHYEGVKVLVSNSSSVNLVYVADIEDAEIFDATFTELLVRLLASKIAYRITGNKSERDSHIAIFKEELALCQSIDSQEGVVDRIEVSTFLGERL
jgi:hypothetical protein